MDKSNEYMDTFYFLKKLEKEYRHDNTVINSDRARVKLPIKPLFI